MTSNLSKQLKLNYGAKRHHYSMFDVGRSRLSKQPCTAKMQPANADKQVSTYGARPLTCLMTKPSGSNLGDSKGGGKSSKHLLC